MVFIDNLPMCLFAASFSAILVLYMTLGTFYKYRKGTKISFECIESGILPLSVLGVFMLIMGIVGELAWPLPGSYNILFFDPLVMLGIVLISFSLSVVYKKKMRY